MVEPAHHKIREVCLIERATRQVDVAGFQGTKVFWGGGQFFEYILDNPAVDSRCHAIALRRGQESTGRHHRTIL